MNVPLQGLFIQVLVEVRVFLRTLVIIGNMSKRDHLSLVGRDDGSSLLVASGGTSRGAELHTARDGL